MTLMAVGNTKQQDELPAHDERGSTGGSGVPGARRHPRAEQSGDQAGVSLGETRKGEPWPWHNNPDSFLFFLRDCAWWAYTPLFCLCFCLHPGQ